MKISEFRKLIREEVRKILSESVMSDVNLLAKESISFNAFAVNFFKKYGNDLDKGEKLAYIKWLKEIYMLAKKGT